MCRDVAPCVRSGIGGYDLHGLFGGKFDIVNRSIQFYRH